MRRVISRGCQWSLLAGCSLLAAAGCSGRGETKTTAAKDSVPAKLIVGEPIVHGSLTIFPVLSSVPKETDRFITLDEGLAAGTVQVCEVGSDAARTDQTGDEDAGGGIDPFEDATADESSPAEMPAEEPADEAAPQTAVVAAEPPTEDALDEDPFGDANQQASARPQQAAARAHRARAHRARARVVFNAGANVNQLLVTNSSPRPLYLMPGEIFVGGQQDRTLAEELVVAPGTKNLPINVFCVEHGRWAARSTNQLAMVIAFPEGDSPDAANVAQLAGEAAKGKFVQSGIALSKAARMTVQKDQDQQAVWDSVAKVNATTGAETDSQAFTANYAAESTTGKIEPFVEALQDKVAKTDRVVGVIVAINGRIDVADVFESTPLFRKLWPKLLKSYALEASTAPAEQSCSLAEAREFLDKAVAAQTTATKRDDGRVMTQAESEELASFSLHESTALPADGPFDVELDGDGERPGTARGVRGAMGGMGGGMGGAGFGGGVHSSAFSK